MQINTIVKVLSNLHCQKIPEGIHTSLENCFGSDLKHQTQNFENTIIAQLLSPTESKIGWETCHPQDWGNYFPLQKISNNEKLRKEVSELFSICFRNL